VPLVVGSLIAAGALRDVDELPGAVPALLVGAAVLVALAGVTVVPQLRWRRWRYEVREEEIDLRRGAFVVTRTLVPMSRVQHVDTRRTVVSQLFGLSAVIVHTAAGTNAIPALTEAGAAEIRDRIAGLARVPGDDPV
jgi:membrane protein YdbS with pleckstrin-like domain